MNVLFVQHADCEGPGLIGTYLDKESSYTVVKLPEMPVPDPTVYDAVVVLGSPRSVNDPDMFLKEERMMMRKALLLRKPVLGICFGVQQLAAAAGGKIVPSKIKEYGIVRVESVNVERTPFSVFPKRFPVMQWHGETFEVGQEAQLHVRGAAVANQAISYQTGIGIQFHLEATPSMVREWCDIYRSDLDAQNIDPRSIVNEFREHEEELKDLCMKFCQAFFS